MAKIPKRDRGIFDSPTGFAIEALRPHLGEWLGDSAGGVLALQQVPANYREPRPFRKLELEIHRRLGADVGLRGCGERCEQEGQRKNGDDSSANARWGDVSSHDVLLVGLTSSGSPDPISGLVWLVPAARASLRQDLP